jgi:polar amino acid transport system substrate-binding protein
MLRKLLVGFLVVTLAVVLGVGTAIAKDKYIVASDVSWAPFEMPTAGGEFYGFELDTIRAIAVVAGLELEIQNVGFSTIIESVKSGKADIGISGFTITEDRAKSVDFSGPYFLAQQAIVMRKDSGLNAVTALIGKGPNKAVGAQSGTTGADWVETQLRANGIDVQLKEYDTYPMAILDLVNKRTDAVIQDEPASRFSLRDYPNDLEIGAIINTNEYYGILVPKGDPKGILPKINAAMVALGLSVKDAGGGRKALVVTQGSVWDNLLTAYFGPAGGNAPASDKTEAAWLKYKSILLNAKTLADVQQFASSFVSEAAK